MSSSHTNTNTNQTTNQTTSADTTTAPSLLASHASYAKGAAEVRTLSLSISPTQSTSLTHAQSTIGTLTSNPALQNSGDATKKHAVEDMRAAANETPTEESGGSAGKGEGEGEGPMGKGGLAAKAEEVVGGVVGCEGMRGEGRKREREKEKKA
ncbi:hypothetical protein BKA81DRAFT_381995 [Phyllosticta paracitricarpa]